MMLTIFISYSRINYEAVEVLMRDIEALGNDVWLDKELEGGQSWWLEILARIRESDLFLYALSSESLNSTACIRECSYALSLGKPVLPVLLSDDVSLNLLPTMLVDIHHVDFRAKDRDAVLALAKALSSITPNGPLPDPLPPLPEAPVSYLGKMKEEIDGTAILNFEAQSALLLRLKEQLENRNLAGDVRILLGRLRRRDDLFARIGDEIDMLLLKYDSDALGISQSTTCSDAETSRAKPSAEHQRTPRATKPRRAKRLFMTFIGMLVSAGLLGVSIAVSDEFLRAPSDMVVLAGGAAWLVVVIPLWRWIAKRYYRRSAYGQ